MKYTTEEGRKILKGADVIIVDGDCIVPKEIHQIVLHVVAALPGDEVNLDTGIPQFILLSVIYITDVKTLASAGS